MGLLAGSHKSMEATSSLMTHHDVNLILATGGSGLVKAAYSSGKPAYGVGPGNVPVYIHETANVKKAVSMIVDSKSFDQGTICASEQAIVADRAIYDEAIRELQARGAYLLSQAEKSELEKVISPAPGKINPKIVGKSAAFIAGIAGITVKDEVRVLVAEETIIGKEIPFSLEKLSPVLALYKAEKYDHAKELCTKLLDLGGRGHSFSIHSSDEKVVKEFSLELPVSRILVNTLATIGAVGGTTGLAPSFTLGCGTFGGNITGDNITARHLFNVKRVAYGTKETVIPPKGSLMIPEKRKSVEDETNKIIHDVIKSLEKREQVNLDEISAIVSAIMLQIAK